MCSGGLGFRVLGFALWGRLEFWALCCVFRGLDFWALCFGRLGFRVLGFVLWGLGFRTLGLELCGSGV